MQTNCICLLIKLGVMSLYDKLDIIRFYVCFG